MNRALVQARKAAGFETLTDAAKALRVSLGYYSRLEAGLKSNPSRKLLRRISDTFRTSAIDLFDETAPESQSIPA